MMKSVGEFSILGVSAEILASSDISSLSNVPVDFAKSCPCSTGADSLVNLLFLAASVLCSSGPATLTGLWWISTSVCGDHLLPSNAFWLLYVTIGSKLFLLPSFGLSNFS